MSTEDVSGQVEAPRESALVRRPRSSIHALLLLLAPVSCAVPSLAGTTWEEAPAADGVIECPDVLQFDAGGYVYFNDCHAPGLDGIVETGTYAFTGGKLRLRDRRIASVGSRLGSDADSLEVRVTRTGDAGLVLSVDGKEIAFRRR